jgi:hypothetical protein
MSRRNPYAVALKRGPKEKYPWSTMGIGDTFFVSDEDAKPSSVRAMASAKGRDLGRKFSVTNGAGGMHVDRVS